MSDESASETERKANECNVPRRCRIEPDGVDGAHPSQVVDRTLRETEAVPGVLALDGELHRSIEMGKMVENV